MFWENIVSDINLSGEKIVKKDIIKTKYFNIVMVYLGKNQEIPPHPEPYAVFFFVLQGRGKFTKKDELYMLHKDSCIFFESNEIRGIKSHEDLILLGIQEPH
jgi:quercetin dioxygenase-like cupin family protein